jgi:hypothetical protein
VVFLHPVHGKVAGYCEKAEFCGYSEPGHIPDFQLTLVGRSVKRNVVTVRLVESRATFFETEREAVEESKLAAKAQ